MTFRPRLCLLPFFTALIICFFPLNAQAKRIAEQNIPDTLKPWIGWVLHGHEEKRCPSQYDNENSYRCLWPSRLELEVDNKEGHFSQKWRIFNDDWISLPGEKKFWPQEVKVDGKKASVLEREGRPAVYLEKGEHVLTGRFFWKEMPEAIQLPPESALIDFKIMGKNVDFPNFDSQGKLWLKGLDQRGGEKGKVEDRLDLKIFRRIVDDIPLMMTTRIDMDVAGSHREVLLARAVDDGYIPLHLMSTLPVRIEADGRLRVQVKPGRWSVTLTTRHDGPVYDIPFEGKEGLWVKEEIWAFEAKPSLRMVEIEGGTVVDPQQTTLPDDWRHLPAYRIKAGESLHIVEKKRGDPDPPMDQLELTRDIWLDFDGRGYTLKDSIKGSMRRGWRLEMNAPVKLGRVSIDGRDQFITRMSNESREGVEVRKGAINLQADSRLTRTTWDVPIAWEQDFQKVGGRLHLPPGWRIFDAGGVDRMPGTWLKSWNLLDFFIVLIIALSFMKLWTRNWGIVALIALVLFYHEAGAPKWIWLHILAAIGLLRVLPQGKARNFMEVYKWLALVVLILMSVPFMVNEIRQGIYPQLEKPWVSAGKKPVDAMYEKQLAPEPGLVMEEEVATEKFVENRIDKRKRPFSSGRGVSDIYTDKPYGGDEILHEYDPRATIQTGPGLPDWTWNTFFFRWNGPLEKNQFMKLILIPPFINGLLCFLRVFLLILLILKLAGVGYGGRGGSLSFGGWKTAGKGAVVVILLLGILRGTAVAGDIPSRELLDELRTKLLETPECAPRCADSQRLYLHASADRLTLRMAVESYAETFIPLPGQVNQWLPDRVQLNGSPAKGLYRNPAGQLWLNVPKGSHEVLMTGPLPKRQSVQIPLPLNPHRVEANVKGWTLEGLHDNGITDGQVQLNRIDSGEKKSGEAGTLLEASTLPPFVRIERTLRMGLTWQIITRVIRESHPDAAILLEVPLVKGESVTSENVRVKNGKVSVNMPPGGRVMEWASVLEISDQVELKAAENNEWTEIWKLDLSPVWHAEITGIPAIHHQDSRGSWLPEWRPWPGESVTISITRPEGIEGQTLTIDRSLLEVSPGRTATDATLSLSMRSSRGGQHKINLPQGSSLLEVKINNRTQPIRLEEGDLPIPVSPGHQVVFIKWRMPEGMRFNYSTPLVDLGISSVNGRTEIEMPQNRWVLFTKGPTMGPAVLFWGILLVILLISAGLGQITITPLGFRQWMLLGVGLSQLEVIPAAIVVAWFLLLGLRAKIKPGLSKLTFNSIQTVLVLLTLAALASLFSGISQGLLGHPEMHIAGNGSYGYRLNWFQDRSGNLLPTASVISVPLLVYRFLMLAWSLWIASALISWLKWAWTCFSTNGIWEKVKPRVIMPGSEKKKKEKGIKEKEPPPL